MIKGREALHSVHLSAAGSMAISTGHRILLTFILILLSHRVSCVIPIPKGFFPFCACSLAVSPPFLTSFNEATQNLKGSFGTISTIEAFQQSRQCLLQGRKIL